VNHFGIDFGTTNSGAFELNSRQFYGDEEARPLPSIIVIDKATNRVFGGRKAWNDRLSLIEKGNYHVIPSVKALLETDQEWSGDQKRWTVPDVAAEVLRQLNERTQIAGGIAGGITEATFSIPIDMPPKARRNLREAARRAGIQVTGFVKESTAAVIRYWERMKNCRYVVIFDWGGGTLDISVLELKGHHINELVTRGSPIAGNRIDEDLARFVHRSIMKQRNSSRVLEELPAPQQDDLRFRCENAKCLLATSQESKFTLYNYDGAGEEFLLTRANCRPVIEPHVKSALDLLAAAISKARLSVDAIDEIIILGGCSQLWLFREQLRNDSRFRSPYLAENPEWDVAHGAAVLQKSPGCFALGESLALELSDGTRFELVCPGDRAGSTKRSVSLALVEDARAANIIIQRQINQIAEPETALQFSIPTQGFDLEEIRLDYLLTEDLTFHIAGQSLAKNEATSVERETGELRFMYAIDETL